MIKDEDILDEPFDPKKYTVKSFMQVLYHQNTDIIQRMTAVEKDVERLTSDLEKREERAKEDERRWSKRLKWIGLIGVGVGFLIDFLIARYF